MNTVQIQLHEAIDGSTHATLQQKNEYEQKLSAHARRLLEDIIEDYFSEDRHRVFAFRMLVENRQKLIALLGHLL